MTEQKREEPRDTCTFGQCRHFGDMGATERAERLNTVREARREQVRKVRRGTNV